MTLDKIITFKEAKNFYSRPYDLLNDNHIKFIFSIGNGFFILIFLWLFGPFGLALFPSPVKLNLIFWYSLISSSISVIHVYLFQRFIIKRFTIGITIFWLFWIISVCGIGNFIIWEVIMNNGQLIWRSLPKMMGQTYLVGSLGCTFIIILYEKYYLKKKIRITNQVNTDILQLQRKDISTRLITITSLNLSDVITVDSDSLLYIVSADNYAEVNWLERGRIKKYLIRKTLTELEKELKKQCRYILRCHNGYIVNANKINSVSGNSGGYMIFIQGIVKPIPVSRKYKEAFFKAISQ